MRRVWGIGVVLGTLAGCLGGSAPPPCEGSPGQLCRIAGTGERAFNGDGMPAWETSLNLVSAVREGPDGRIHIMDFNNMMLRKIEKDGHVTTLAGNGVHAFAEVDQPPLESPLENPVDFAWAPNGEIVFISLHDPRVIRLSADGEFEVIAGSNTIGNAGDGGPAADATFFELAGIDIAPDGTIYVSDHVENRVRVIHPDGTINAFAGTGEAGYAGDGGAATEALLEEPTGIALDGEGGLYIADHANHTIRHVTADGMIETVAGTGEPGYSGDGGPASEATLLEPDGVAVAEDGSVFVSDAGNHVIRQINPDGTIETAVGNGNRGFGGDGGPALEAELNKPARLSVSDGVLYIADQLNSCARAYHFE